MKRNHHLKELIENIKKTDEMISLHRTNNTLSIMVDQYEALKAKQISELIDGLAMPPYQSIESISVIKHILNKFYPNIPEGLVKQKELKELEDTI
jgi:hypothetical protein